MILSLLSLRIADLWEGVCSERSSSCDKIFEKKGNLEAEVEKVIEKKKGGNIYNPV